MNDDELERRLRATYADRAERAAIAADHDSDVPETTRPDRSTARRGATAILAAAVLAGCAWAGLEMASTPVEGAFNPGQPLHCSGIESMTPREAQQELERRGYIVDWQYHPEQGAPAVRERPPEEAVIIEVTLTDDRALVLAEGSLPTDPLHQRRRNGETNCEDSATQQP